MTKPKTTRQVPRVICWGACKQPNAGPCSVAYPPNRVVCEGEIAHGMPIQSIRHELEAGHIEMVDVPAEDGNE